MFKDDTLSVYKSATGFTTTGYYTEDIDHLSGKPTYTYEVITDNAAVLILKYKCSEYYSDIDTTGSWYDCYSITLSFTNSNRGSYNATDKTTFSGGQTTTHQSGNFLID
jgi:hypothetical protein